MSQRRARILVVDDLPLLRKAIRRALTATCDVEEASNGREALDLIDLDPMRFDVVVSDVVMPVMSGIDLFRDLRDHDPLSHHDHPLWEQGYWAVTRHADVQRVSRDWNTFHNAPHPFLPTDAELVVVASPSLDSARAASLTLDWLNENGFRDLVADAVAVLNSDRDLEQIEVDRVQDHFARRCRAVARIPWDPHLEAGAVSNPDRLAPATRAAYLRLAAVVADGFDLPSRRRLQHLDRT